MIKLLICAKFLFEEFLASVGDGPFLLAETLIFQHVLPAITGSKFESFRSNRFMYLQISFLQEVIGFSGFLSCIVVYQVKFLSRLCFREFQKGKEPRKMLY